LLDSDRPLTVTDRLLLQACLGSDTKKELYSMAQYWQGTPEPSLLFKPLVKKPARSLPAFLRVRTEKERAAQPIPGALDDDVPY
jgi:hypothetical protein